MSISTFYRVSISGVTAAAPSDGFIDNRTIERYRAMGATPGLTVAHTRAKERANIRYEYIVANLGLMANCYVDNVDAPSATASAAPTSFAFTCEVERGDEVLSTQDELVAGARLTGTQAIRRCVARALIMSKTDATEYYDPTTTTAPGNTTAAVRMGPRIEPITVGSLAANLTAAEALITVTKIANVG